jgi:glycosyltransferase involved in cell wall biosynthesis
MNPLISVIIPFYKTPYIKLRLCIESFINQYLANIEIILIDDGNTSEYQDIVMDYTQSDKRIRYFRQENMGVSAARNNGLKQALGDYIVFADSDDYVEKNFLDTMYEGLKDYDLVICGVCEQTFSVVNMAVDIKVFCSMPSIFNLIQYTNFTVNKMFRKKIIEDKNIRFDLQTKLGEDALFIYSYLLHCKKIRCISDQLYHYVPSETSAVHTYYEQYWKWEELVIIRQRKLFTSYPLNENEMQSMQRWLYLKLRGAMYYYISNEKDRGRQKVLIEEIISNSLFKEIADNYSNSTFDFGDRINILAWKNLGYGGAMLSYCHHIRK